MTYKKISDATIERLDNADLLQIMAAHGHYPVNTKDTRNHNFCCPFHGEKTPSFKISKGHKRGGHYNTPLWKCFGECANSSGYGAIYLEARLSGLDPKSDFHDVLSRISSICNIHIDEIDVKHVNGILEKVPAQNEYTFELRDTFTVDELKALGCECKKIYITKDGRTVPKTDEKGNPVYKYSWGPGFKDDNIEEPNFDPDEISRMFNLYPVKSYIREANKEKGNDYSVKITATETFPIFVFMYDDKTWGRIYQPQYTKIKDGDADYRFSFWYNKGARKKDLNKMIYGTTLIMDMIDGMSAKKAATKYDQDIDIRELDNDGNPILEEKRRIPEIILCSGGSDAINVYFNSGKQVCWPNSESFDLSEDVWDKLDRVAIEKYILFDIDDTGKKKALRAAIRHIDLRVIFLPEKLKEYSVYKGGRRKACKDAKDYFANYDPKTKEDVDESIRQHFLRLLRTSTSLKFWTKNEKKKDGVVVSTSYSINSARVYNFLGSQGLFRTLDKNNPENKVGYYVMVTGNIVETIDRDSIGSVAKTLMKDYILRSPHYCEGLYSAIIDSPRINPENMSNLQLIDLDFHSWGENFDYLFFKNTAVKITPKKIETVPYDKIPYAVNKIAIKEDVFRLQKEEPFTIDINPEYTRLKELQKEMDHRTGSYSKEEYDDIELKLQSLEQMGQYLIKWNKPMEEQSSIIKVLYNQGRTYWKKEIEQGLPLTDEERMEQDAHFINKICAMGMALYRYRSSGLPYMLFLTDSVVKEEGKASGGTGKTYFAKYLLNYARYVCNVDGKTFDPQKGALSFRQYLHGRDTIVHIEDLDHKVPIQSLYVMSSSGFEARKMHKEGISVSKDEAPILVLSTNYQIDMRDDSTQRRLLLIGMSDYYHSKNFIEGKKKRDLKEDFPDIANPSESSLNDIFNLSAMAIKFFMNVQEAIQPPMRELADRALIAATSPKFVVWAHDYFSRPYHLNVPLDRDTMMDDFIDFSGMSNYAKDKSAIGTFKGRLQIYCQFKGMVMNPEIVLRTDTDKRRQEMRVKAWRTRTFKGQGVEGTVRVLQSSPGCLYFCMKDSIPQTFEEVGRAPEVDPEPIILENGVIATLTKEQLDEVEKNPYLIATYISDMKKIPEHGAESHNAAKPTEPVEPELPF